MMSSIFNPSKVLCTMKREKIEHGVFVGIILVLTSAALSGELLEIITGLVGAVVVYMMKERSSKQRACAAKVCKTQGCFDVSDHKKPKHVKSPLSKPKAVGPSTVSAPKFVPRFHQAEPRMQLSVASESSLCEQVDKLLHDVLPDKTDNSVCDELARLVSPCIKKLIPEAQVDIVAQSSLVRIGRTGLRPEVDLLVTVPPKVLAQRLLTHMQEHAGDNTVRKLDKIMEVDENTLNKFAIRAVSAQLSFLKLWRTAYRGVEPKVVLLAPRCLGFLSEDMHVHVYVNCPNTIRSKEVFNESDSHVQKLIAFVRRWAQDRCIGNTAYGHMPLYGWSLFAKFFCQSQEVSQSKKSTAELFGEFVDFYIKWQDSFGQAEAKAALQIADPYDANHNVAECMTPTGMKRFREELERAKKLLASGSSLLTILEHCNPAPQGVDSASQKRYGSSLVARMEKDDAEICADSDSQDS